MTSVEYADYDTPTWTGWNSRLHKASINHQQIFYLPQINHSPTSYAVVRETLNRSLKIAEESNKDSINVTFDLAIAKMAMQIQDEERPKYDKVFISLGPFHIKSCFMGILGQLIAESGGPFVLIESGVLAKGSLLGFRLGKNYKRCVKLNELLALALETLHFQAFLESKEDRSSKVEAIVAELAKIKEEEDLDSHKWSKEMEQVFTEYKEFEEKTEQGEQGKTSQFWMNYIKAYHLYHEFDRSIRTGNFEDFVSCLPKISEYCFAFNKCNYSRWLL